MAPLGKQQAPKSYLNWAASKQQDKPRSIKEYGLYSDSRIGGLAMSFGPYRVVPMVRHNDGAWARVAVLRVKWFSPETLEKTDMPNASLQEEVAALLSMILRIRLKATVSYERSFSMNRKERLPGWDDLAGYPQSLEPIQIPFFPPPANSAVIPMARKAVVDIKKCSAIRGFRHLQPEQALAAVRSARFYQDALWLAENQSWLSWLFLVGACEAAANCHFGKPKVASAELMEAEPSLYELCFKSGGQPHVDAVAHELAGTLKSLKKFLDFLTMKRVAELKVAPRAGSLNWSEEGIRKALTDVYKLRSNALHAGVGFPLQLCNPATPSGDGFVQVPLHSFTHDPLPMHIHVFEHIVWNALLPWFKAMANAGISSKAKRKRSTSPHQPPSRMK